MRKRMIVHGKRQSGLVHFAWTEIPAASVLAEPQKYGYAAIADAKLGGVALKDFTSCSCDKNEDHEA